MSWKNDELMVVMLSPWADSSGRASGVFEKHVENGQNRVMMEGLLS